MIAMLPLKLKELLVMPISSSLLVLCLTTPIIDQRYIPFCRITSKSAFYSPSEDK